MINKYTLDKINLVKFFEKIADIGSPTTLELKPLDKSLNKLIHACKEVTASVRLEPILRYGTFIFDGDDVVVVVYILLHIYIYIYIYICFFAKAME